MTEERSNPTTPPTATPAADKKTTATKTAATGSTSSTSKPSGGRRKYITKKDLAYFRRLFHDMHNRIINSNERLLDEMKDNPDVTPDDNDRASKESEFSMVLRGRDRERQLMSKINQALRRIDNGNFGYCDECGEPIGLERLKARPVATLCIECKNLQEEFEKSGGISLR